MGVLITVQQIRDSCKGAKVFRFQRCTSCRDIIMAIPGVERTAEATVLAVEVTDKMGFGGEYYKTVDCMIVKGAPEPLLCKERWFGNRVRCPVCGVEGRLPMDKPLSWEEMENQKQIREEPNANQRNA